MISPNKETIDIFRTDLWKDQRKLETRIIKNDKYFVKHYGSTIEADHEKAILKFLHKELVEANVPTIVEESTTSAQMPYLKGIRVFNLLVEIDQLKPPLHFFGRKIKKLILDRCEANQREIQKALHRWGQLNRCPAYPPEKITTLIEVLANCLNIDFVDTHLQREVKSLNRIIAEGSIVPFRDATTKNMVLTAPELWLGNFHSEEERRHFLYNSLLNEQIPKWMDAPIVDFDFASCINSTTPEDDVISLRYHERSWSGKPCSEKKLVWTFEPDARRAAASFFVRYYRFGGRKAAYRLLHPTGHRIRFRHDNDIFYFEQLPSVMMSLWPDANKEFPILLNFTETVAKHLKIPISVFDFFKAENIKEKRKYFVDMFPE